MRSLLGGSPPLPKFYCRVFPSSRLLIEHHGEKLPDLDDAVPRNIDRIIAVREFDLVILSASLNICPKDDAFILLNSSGLRDVFDDGANYDIYRPFGFSPTANLQGEATPRPAEGFVLFLTLVSLHHPHLIVS